MNSDAEFNVYSDVAIEGTLKLWPDPAVVAQRQKRSESGAGWEWIKAWTFQKRRLDVLKLLTELAQLEEHSAFNRVVVGSSPILGVALLTPGLTDHHGLRYYFGTLIQHSGGDHHGRCPRLHLREEGGSCKSSTCNINLGEFGNRTQDGLETNGNPDG